MQFIPAEPDIATVFRRLKEGDIDLQPDFQRGEVWPTEKKQRLIDSILRGWVIPPVLLISRGHGELQQVLDGQQRLASIRDFLMGKFKIDGQVEPLDEHIQSLDGLTFDGLPDADSRAFLRTPVRLYEIKHYKPEEPAEIFFRLNQPTALTAAEKRNAFYGPVRDQIRQIVVRFVGGQLEPESALGFTNSRMAFDDVFARLACTLEIGTLRKKVTAPAVNQMYRRSTPLSDMVEKKLEYCVDIWWSVSQIVSSSLPDNYPRLNKATFFSWLLFYSRLTAVGDLKSIANFFIHFESVRKKLSGFDSDQNRSRSPQKDELLNNLSQLMLVYSDRASARVADVSSVMLRDFVLWASWQEFSGGNKAGCVDPAYLRIDGWRDRNRCGADHFESKLLEFIELIHWGETL